MKIILDESYSLNSINLVINWSINIKNGNTRSQLILSSLRNNQKLVIKLISSDESCFYI